MAKQDLQEVLDLIVEAVQSDDQELLIDTIDGIEEEYWLDAKSSSRIMDTFFGWVSSEFFVYPISFIPDSFWENEALTFEYVQTVCGYYEEERIDYNFTEIMPKEVLNDKDILRMLLRCNCMEVIYYLPSQFSADAEIVFSALEGLENHIRYRENASMLTPPDIKECVGMLLEKISKDLSKDKDFILEFLNNYYFADAFSLIYEWTDKDLWSDKDFVLSVLKNDESEEAISYISKDLREDEEIKEYI